jgi:hypothetical protein
MGGKAWLGVWLVWVLMLVLTWPAPVAAQAVPAVQVLREPSGIYMSARLPLDIPDGLEEVLLRGVPMHFIWQADVRRARWYWSDERVATAYRVVRVAYQPLTRRWRVSVGAGQHNELALVGALHQNLESFDQAMSTVLSVSRWQLLDAEPVPDARGLYVELQFRIDGGLLPRPFLPGHANPLGWGASYHISVPVTVAEPGKAPS